MSQAAIHHAVIDVHLPAGIAGPDPMDFDVRCFLVPHGAGVVLVDTGLAESPATIGGTLQDMGATWDDVTDVVLTHGHPDHVGGLAEVVAQAPRAAVWGSARDPYEGPVRAIAEGDSVRGLGVLETPGHTPGHVSLLAEDWGALLVGDAVGTQAGQLVRPPARFTADAAEAERSLHRLAGLAVERMLFAHGQEIDRPMEALRQFL